MSLTIFVKKIQKILASDTYPNAVVVVWSYSLAIEHLST